MELPKEVGVPAAARRAVRGGGGNPRSLPLPPSGGLVLESSGRPRCARGPRGSWGVRGPALASFVWRLSVRVLPASRHVGGAYGLWRPNGDHAGPGAHQPRRRVRRGVGWRLEKPRPVAPVTSPPIASLRASVSCLETLIKSKSNKKASLVCRLRGAGF